MPTLDHSCRAIYTTLVYMSWMLFYALNESCANSSFCFVLSEEGCGNVVKTCQCWAIHMLPGHGHGLVRGRQRHKRCEIEKHIISNNDETLFRETNNNNELMGLYHGYESTKQQVNHALTLSILEFMPLICAHTSFTRFDDTKDKYAAATPYNE